MELHPPATAPIDTYADGLNRQVHGTVTQISELQHQNEADEDTSFESSDTPEQSNARKWNIDIAVDQVEYITSDISQMTPVQGGVRLLWTAETPPTLHCGDTLALPMRLFKPQRYRDPGVWQYADYLAENGIRLRATTRAQQMDIIPASHLSFSCKLALMQQWAAQRIPLVLHTNAVRKLPAWMRLSAEDAGTINAMLLGDRSHLHKSLRLHFERTGTFHLLVVAGLHIGLVAALLLWVLQRIGTSRITSTIIALPVLVFYATLTGFGAPVQRALFMTVVFLFVRALSRRSTSLNALGFALLAMLIVKPSSLFEAGLQMTALAVIAIAGIGHPLAERTFLPYLRATRDIHRISHDSHLAPSIAQFRVQLRLLASALAPKHSRRMTQALAMLVRATLWSLELLLLSVVSEMLMSLPMAYYFHRLTPLALPANILCIVLVGPLMVAASLLFFAACIHPWLAAIPATVTAILLHGMEFVIRHISTRAIADIRVPLPQLWQIASMLLAICLWLWAIRRRNIWIYFGVASIAIAFALLLVPLNPAHHNNAIEVTAIDVGQGDSLLMVAPNGTTMLIDAGGPVGQGEEERTSTFDIGEEVVSPYLWQRGIRHLDVVALTHAHSDHMGGMAAVIRNFHPRELWLSVQPESQMFQQLLATARETGTQLRYLHKDDSMQWNDVQINALAPDTSGFTHHAPSNDDSLVLHAKWQRASALLEGDAERKSETAMLQELYQLSSTLLKVAHHGSLTSTTESFLEAVSPQFALISDGRDNHFGHPRMEVLERLQKQHVRTYRTDMLGAVSMYLHSDGTVDVSTAIR